MRITFTCHRCGRSKLESINTGVNVITPIDILLDTGTMIQGPATCEDGQLQHFRCHHCYELVRDVHGLPVNNPQDLVALLTSRTPQPIPEQLRGEEVR